VNVRRLVDSTSLGLLDIPEPTEGRRVLSEELFHRMISQERRRTERSHKPFLVVLLDMGDELTPADSKSALAMSVDVLSLGTRETDVVGWYKNDLIVGVMFTEIDAEAKKDILATMLNRISMCLKDNLSFEQFSQLSVSFHWFPEEWGNGVPKRPSDSVLYPDLTEGRNARTLPRSIKRLMDIAGSVVALVLFSPLLVMIALAVKVTSRGPVVFRQERLGQLGKTFTCLKFRSMHENNDLAIHREFMKHVIRGEYKGEKDENGQLVCTKMTDDPRITKIGRFLRRTSLDELPQFINVLKGEMSLVGPRPPLAYECQQYDLWHRRRVLEAKPGITGLWQVNGRSRVRFDDMVRLDLRYARTCSTWLDIKILLMTPGAVLLGNDSF
jgi:lipopolysaccharide/colanic/teichoic acid biosynthesis glycosyltransferase